MKICFWIHKNVRENFKDAESKRECGGWRRVSEPGVETGEKTKHKRKTLELPLGKYWFEILNSGFALKLGEQNLKL